MALFERTTRQTRSFGGDAATRALSVTAVENDFVERVYEKLAGVYDLTFGPTLHPGRLEAIERMAHPPGRPSARSRRRHRHQPRALSARPATITGIDLSSEDAREGARAHRRRRASRNCRVMEMDAAKLTFADDSFDIVYAPYLISVVPDPVAGRARDAPRLPARRPHRHPQPLQEHKPAAGADRDGDLADHRAHRLQVRSRPARRSSPRPT